MADKGVLTIDDPEAAELAAELERLSGRPVGPVVVKALREEVERLRPRRRRKIDMDRLRQIQERVRSRPVVDDRTPNELIGYNEYGTFD